ncbi:MAG TPA: CHAT domain-containing tetratricopeptide repeat protein [Myxococcaceae bacterium]
MAEAQAVFDEAQKLLDAGRYAEGIPHGERALALCEAVLGENHPEVARRLDLAGELHLDHGDFARAEALFQRGLTIREAAFGKDHPAVATSLHHLAQVYGMKGLFDRAEPLHLRALAIREAALGKNHPDVAASLDGLAGLSWPKGQYGEAEQLAQRALAIWEAAPQGKGHPEASTALITLATIFRNQGLLERGERLLQRALDVREAALGDGHPGVAVARTLLAVHYMDTGMLERAEPLLTRALEAQEAAHNDIQVSALLLLLGGVYLSQGSYDRAEPLLRRAVAMAEAALGGDHPLVAQRLIALGNLFVAQQQYDRAEPLHQRAIAILEASTLKSPLLLGVALMSLGRVYQQQGFLGRAEPLMVRALALFQQAVPTGHPAVLGPLFALANLYRDEGAYDRSGALYQRAIALLEGFGGDSPYLSVMLGELARLRLAEHRPAEAPPLLMRALTIAEGRLRRESLGFSESRLASLLQTFRPGEELCYALLRARPRDRGAAHLALTMALLLKGRSVEEIAGTSRAISRSLAAEDRDAFERLRGVRTQLASLSFDGAGAVPPAIYQQRLKALTDQGDALEAQLARRSAPLRALAALPSPDSLVDRVAAALPEDGALVEIVAYEDRPLVPKPGTPASGVPGQLRYQAMVLFPDGRIRACDLGPAAPIDSAASRLHDALASRDAAYQDAARKLYQLAFRPLRPLLGGARRLFLAPDGQLSLVPFAALHDGRRFLVEAFDITYLTSGKDLLPRSGGVPPARSVVIFANPDFASGPPAPVATPGPEAALAERSYSVERFFSAPRGDLADRPWPPLPGTRQEALALQRLFPGSQLFVGPEASKERLLHLEAPGVLHIATHGFFLEEAAAPEGSRGVDASGPLGGAIPAPGLPDPLLRSGLVLSGARSPGSQDGGTPERRLDGSLVTALELAGLDLWGTQLVVLSACDTGRGDVKLGQGVYGLRRALAIAGAETVVMSLWKVDDETTSALMERYYRNLLDGPGRVTALREAMLALRAQQPHPYHWAPFIAAGRDAPLRELAPAGP